MATGFDIHQILSSLRLQVDQGSELQVHQERTIINFCKKTGNAHYLLSHESHNYVCLLIIIDSRNRIILSEDIEAEAALASSTISSNLQRDCHFL